MSDLPAHRGEAPGLARARPGGHAMSRYADPCPGIDRHPDEHGRCEVCGAGYHCAECGRGTGMMGHYAGPDRPLSCHPEEATP